MGKVTPVAKTRCALHIVVTTENGESWILTVVYNPSRIHDQCFVEQELSGMATLNFPWILIRDFNVVTSLNEI